MLDNSLIYEKSLNKANASELDYLLKGENIKYSLKEFLNLKKEKVIREIVKFEIFNTIKNEIVIK